MSGRTEEFWIVSRDQQTVEVSRLDGVRVYRGGNVIPLPLWNGSLAVDEIFA